MFKDFSGTIAADGTVSFAGMDHGPATIVAKKGDVVAIKRAGKKSWAARGRQDYYRTGIYVFRVEWHRPDYFTIKDTIIEWEPSTKPEVK